MSLGSLFQLFIELTSSWGLRVVYGYTAYLILAYCIRTFKVWLKFKDLPQYRESEFFWCLGNTVSTAPHIFFKTYSKTPRIDLLRVLAKKFAKSFCVLWIGWRPLTVILDPSSIYEILRDRNNINKSSFYNAIEIVFGQGLVTSNGEMWRHRRKTLEPAFNTKSLEYFLPTMLRVGEYVVKKVQTQEGQIVELQKFIDPGTLKIILFTEMGIKEDYSEEMLIEPETVYGLSNYVFTAFQNPLLSFEVFRLIYERFTEIGKSMKKFKKASKILVNERLESLQDFEDSEEKKSPKLFIDILLQKYVQDKNSADIVGKFDEKGVHDEIATVFAAGFDTVAHGIGWTLYSLGCELEIQEKLYEEVSGFAVNEGTSLEYFNNFPYLDKVIKEGLRIRPTVSSIQRKLMSDVEINGYTLPKGTDVVLPIILSHLDPENFPNPEKFDPDRFNPENLSKLSKTYFPFATGSRRCIGQNFAILEMKIFIALIIKNFRIVSTKPLSEIPYDFDIVTYSIEPLKVEFFKRH